MFEFEAKFDFEVRDAKKLKGLKVYQDESNLVVF